MLQGWVSQKVVNPVVKWWLEDRMVTRPELIERTRRSNRLWFVDEEPESVTIPPPDDDYPEDFDRFVGSHTVPRMFVTELTDTTVFGPYGAVRTDDLWILECARGSPGSLADAVSAAYRRRLTSLGSGSTDDEELAVTLAGSWATGYFHWFTDYLPCLRGVMQYVERTGRRPTLLIPPDPPDWLCDSIEAVGYPLSACRELTDARVHVETLIVPSKPYGTRFSDVGSGMYSIRGYRWIRERVFESFEVDPAAGSGRRIYVSREDACDRRIVNESSVIDTLEPFGFERYELSALSYREQVSLFADADIVVAPHGAGLTNLIYATDTAVLELFGDYLHLDYYLISEGFEFEYGFLECEAQGNDLVVDTERLVEAVRSLRF